MQLGSVCPPNGENSHVITHSDQWCIVDIALACWSSEQRFCKYLISCVAGARLIPPHSGALSPPVALIYGRGAHLLYIGARYTWCTLSLPVPLVRGGGCGPGWRGEAACRAGNRASSACRQSGARSLRWCTVWRTAGVRRTLSPLVHGLDCWRTAGVAGLSFLFFVDRC